MLCAEMLICCLARLKGVMRAVREKLEAMSGDAGAGDSGVYNERTALVAHPHCLVIVIVAVSACHSNRLRLNTRMLT